jgi:nitrous oxide reductase
MEELQKVATGHVSRRSFIATAGLAAVAGGVLAGTAMATASKEAPSAPATPKAGSWPWVKIDPQEAGERAFGNYHAKGG